MVASNDLNISQAGMVAFDGVFQFFGRTITGGTGVTVTNGNGVSGNPTISLTGGAVAIETINGDTGSISGNTVTIYADNAANNCGSSVSFVNSGTTSTLNVTDANVNTLIGSTAGNGSITGAFNTGLGYKSLNSLQSGNYNIGIGYNSGGSLTTAQSNVAIGYNSLNTATGSVGPNIAIGHNAASLQTSAQNISIGYEAGYQNSSGNLNTAVGDQALYAGLSATQNSCFGYQTGNALTSGSYNTFIGLRSGPLLLTGIENTGLGYATCGAYTTSESNNICIGYNVQGTVGESNVTRIGNGSTAACYITGIDGVNVGSVAKVITEASNQLGTATITGGTGVTVSATANTITISASSSGFSWNNVTGGSATLAAENGYFANAAGLTTFTLPTIISSSTGDTIKIIGLGAGGWVISQLALEQIIVGSQASTAGIGGSVASTNRYDCIELVYSPTSGLWRAESFVGNLTIT